MTLSLKRALKAAGGVGAFLAWIALNMSGADSLFFTSLEALKCSDDSALSGAQQLDVVLRIAGLALATPCVAQVAADLTLANRVAVLCITGLTGSAYPVALTALAFILTWGGPTQTSQGSTFLALLPLWPLVASATVVAAILLLGRSGSRCRRLVVSAATTAAVGGISIGAWTVLRHLQCS